MFVQAGDQLQWQPLTHDQSVARMPGQMQERLREITAAWQTHAGAPEAAPAAQLYSQLQAQQQQQPQLQQQTHVESTQSPEQQQQQQRQLARGGGAPATPSEYQSGFSSGDLYRHSDFSDARSSSSGITGGRAGQSLALHPASGSPGLLDDDPIMLPGLQHQGSGEGQLLYSPPQQLPAEAAMPSAAVGEVDYLGQAFADFAGESSAGLAPPDSLGTLGYDGYQVMMEPQLATSSQPPAAPAVASSAPSAAPQVPFVHWPPGASCPAASAVAERRVASAGHSLRALRR